MRKPQKFRNLQTQYQLNNIRKLSKDKFLQKIQQKSQAQEWKEFDDLEKQERNKEKLSDEEEQSHNQVLKKRKITKIQPTKKQKRLKDITQYEKALKKLRENNFQFHSPFEKQKLNLEYMPVLKMLDQAFQAQLDLQNTLRKMGLKTVKILFKTGAHTCLGLMLRYIKQGQLPIWLIQRYRDLMKKKDNDFSSDQNTLLRTMSHTNNKCLSRQ